MTLKSIKSKFIRKESKHNPNLIQFDSYSFILGGMKIRTDYLTKQTKSLLIKLHNTKQLESLVEKFHYHHNLYNERFVVLTQDEALEMIKHVTLRNERQLLEKEFESNDMFMRKISQQQREFSRIKLKLPNNCYFQCKTIIHQNFAKLYAQVKETKKQLNQKLNDGQTQLRKYMQYKILSIEMQLFISTIVIIVEQFNQQMSENENYLFMPTNCFVIFQQSYPPKSFAIKDLIKIIGEQQYQTKKLHTLKIYDALISSENFSNPTFVTCHDCMRVVTNLSFPQHNLKCLKVVNGDKQKNIRSHFLLTPKRFLDKFINHQFFNFYDQKEFQHGYVQYHLKTGNDELACGRNWCGPCRIMHRRGKSVTHCDFCDFVCQCTRCKRYERIVQLLGHYMKIGGKISDFKDKFVFNQIFGRERLNISHHQGVASNYKLKEYILRKDLKLMYESQVKMNDELKTCTHWLQLKKQSLLSGVFPQQMSLEFPSQIFFHEDQLRRKNMGQLCRSYEKNRKNYKKYLYEKREKNFEMKLSKLDESIKERMIQAQTEQLVILKRKLQNAKVLKTTNPLTNHRTSIDNQDVIIIQQSSLRKNERKFHQKVNIIEQNPLNRAEQERQYLKLKRQQRINHLYEEISLHKDEEYESISYISDENQSQIQSDNNGSNNDSIWNEMNFFKKTLQ